MDAESASGDSMDVVDDASLQQAFGRQMRRLRAKLGVSQEELASRCRLDRSYIGSVERGERNVSLQNIWRIADALGADPGELFNDGHD